jgi:hypothetical protein
VKARWLVLGLLGAVFSGAAPDPPVLDASSSEATPAEAPPAEVARSPGGHRAAGPHFYVWQEEPEEAASWAAVLGPLDRPRPRK